MLFQMTLAARYLNGRKLRTLLTTLAVVFGVFVVFGMNIMLPAMLQAFRSSLMAAAQQVDLTVTRTTGEAFSPDVVDRVAAVPGVVGASGSLERNVNLPADYFDHDPAQSDRVAAVTLVGLDPDAAQALRAFPLNEGRFLQAGEAGAAVVARSLADTAGLKLGDRLELPTTDGQVGLTVVGIQPARTIPGNEEVLVTLAEAQRLTNQAGLINTIEANLDTTDEARRTEIESAVQSALGSGYRLGGLETSSDLFASLKLAQAAFNLFGFLALFMGGFIIFNTFRTVVAERRRDIGLLRAVGASRGTVIGVILMEGLLQGVMGSLVGMAAGYLLALIALRLMAPLMQEFVHVQVGSPIITPSLVLISIVVGVGTTLVAGLLPALGASRVTPLEALRPTVLAAARRAAGWGALLGAVLLVAGVLALVTGQIAIISLGGLLFLVGLVLVAPALVRPFAVGFGALAAWAFAREGTGELAQGNLTRQPSRAAVTASATMIGIAIIVAVGGITTSLTAGFLGILKHSLGSDYLFMPPAIAVWNSDIGAKPELAERLRAVPGVEAVSTLRYAASIVLEPRPATVPAGGASITLLGIEPEAYTRVSGLTFRAGDPGTAFAALARPEERAIIANGPLAATLGLKVGDALTLDTGAGPQVYHVVGVGNDYLNAKIQTGYISQANMAADFGKTEDILLQLNLAKGADAAQVEPQMRAILQDYPQFNLVSGKAYYDENKRIFDAAFVGFYMLIGVLALPSLIALLNTLAIGVIERTREIGMLRAVGATQRQVRRTILAEALLLSAVGTAFGLLAGLYLGYIMVAAVSSAGFPVEYSFPLAGLVTAIAVGLLFGVLAALLPARQAARLEIVRALRYE